MLILVLIDVQYSQNAIFSFERGSNCKNHSSLGSHHLLKKIAPIPAHLLTVFGKPWVTVYFQIYILN